MCGRYGFLPGDKFYERFLLERRSGRLKASYNVAPGSIMPVITKQGRNRLEMMKWGLVPGWAKDPRIGFKMINARAETLKEKPAFRSSLRSKRCLVPASGFYEWLHAEKNKIPYYIKLKDQEMFAFAGLFDIWKDAEGREIKSYTIITTDANKLIARIHDRMPVILRKKDEEAWIDNDHADIDGLLGLLRPYKAGDMESYEVSTLVNSPRNNKKELIEPLKS